jgi:hypothetical protein
MPRYSAYGQADTRQIDEFDAGFFGFNNRFRPDQLKQGILADSKNGRMNLNGEWQVRKGIDAVSGVLIQSGIGITLPFTLNDASPPTIDDSAQPRIWASCAFSNPIDTSGQYLLVATNNRAVATNLATSQSINISYPNGYVLGQLSELLQAFNQVILFSGGNTSLIWDGQFNAILAGSFEIGKNYTIDSIGTTDFTLIGASSNTVGEVFTATGAGSGTGTAFSAFTKAPSGSYVQPVRLGDGGNNTVITDGEVTVDSTAHGLLVGDTIVVLESSNNLTVGDEYQISTIPNANTFTFYAQVDDVTSHNNHYTKPVSQGIGYIRMPAPPFGVYHSERLVVPYEYNVESSVDTFTNRGIKDQVIFSNGLDINTYDDVYNQFRLNAGTADFIVGLHSFSEDKLLIFNRNSIHIIAGTKNLSQSAVSLITDEVGCVARDSIVQVGNTILFLSDNGIYGASFQDLYNLRGNEIPLSESIDSTIQDINKNIWDKSSAVYFDNKYYIAVPLGQNASRNNAVIVYNFVNSQWESIDTVGNDEFDFEKLVVAGDGEFRGVYAVNSFGGVHRLETRLDGVDRVAADASASSLITTHQIPASMITRQYTVGSTDRKKWNTFEITTESSPERASDFNISAETENIDYNLNLGSLSSRLGGSQLAAGEDVSIRGRIGNTRAYGIQFTINNTSGRPRIRSLKTTGGIAFQSTNKAI